jgi:hypothetical protein
MIPKKVTRILLDAWDDIVRQSHDSGLEDLIIRNVEKRYGKGIANPLNVGYFVLGRLSLKPPHERVIAIESHVDVWPQGPYINTKPQWFVFQGEKHCDYEWKEVLVKLCELVAKDNPGEFGRATKIVGDRGLDPRKYFASAPPPGGLRNDRVIGNTGVYVETNLSANNTYDLCVKLLTHFGYDCDDKQVFTTSVDEELARGSA